MKHIKANYVEDGDLYKDALKTAQEVFQGTLMPMQDEYKGAIKKDFDGIRQAIKRAVAVMPSPEVVAALPMIKGGKLNETELDMISDHLNYMDTKLIYDAMGKHFITVENIVEEVDAVESMVNEYFSTFSGQPLEKMSYNFQQEPMKYKIEKIEGDR